MDWQPIETAPKDGRVLLLTAFEDDGEQFERWPMVWMPDKKNGLFPGKTGMWATPDGMITWNGTPEGGGPTHWKLYEPVATPSWCAESGGAE